MKLIRSLFLACVICLALVASLVVSSIAVFGAQIRSGGAVLQTQPTPPGSAPPPTVEGFQSLDERRYLGPVFRLGVPYVLNAGSEISEAVILFGNATIHGRVDGDVVVVFGDLTLGSTAVVEGSVVAIGGVMTAAEGAAVRDDLVIVAGRLDASAGFSPLGQHVVIGPPGLGDGLRNVVPWLTHGLLWGRVIVPSLGWMWPLVFISLGIFLAVAAAFPKAVRACSQTLSARPLSAFFTGLLTLLLIGPLATVLAISVVGIIVIPFAFCAVVIGWVLGKVGVAEWIGAGIVHPDDPDSRGQALRAMLIGFVVLTLVYMVPAIGLAAWALVGLFGLGTATLTFFSALKRERPAPKPKPMMPPPAPPAGPPDLPGPSSQELPLHGQPPQDQPFSPAMPLAAADAASWAGEPAPEPAARPERGGGAAPPPAGLAVYPRATFLDRLGAVVLDVLLLLIARNLLDFRHDDGMLFLMGLAYFIAFLAWKGTTVGGIVCSLRVVRINGEPLRPVDSVVRALSSLFSIAALGIGFLWILLDSNKDRQAWHDKIAGTLVVRVPRDLPL